jgi:hypothetical protein
MLSILPKAWDVELSYKNIAQYGAQALLIHILLQICFTLLLRIAPIMFPESEF